MEARTDAIARLLGAVTLAVGLAGCTVGDVDLEGRRCPCADGYVCDSVRNVCVRPGDGAGGADAGGADAGYCESQPGDLDLGLVAYWRFDEGSGTALADASGLGLDATLLGGCTWVQGALDRAVHFDGIDGYGETGYNAPLSHWSVSTWARGDAAPRSDQDSGPVMKEENFLISWDHSADEFRGAAGVRVGGTDWYAASFGPLEPGPWYHLAATYDGEALRAYRDGQLITLNEAPSGDADNDTTRTLTLGKHAVDPWFFAGAVDETLVYDRALNDAEVSLLYAQCRP